MIGAEDNGRCRARPAEIGREKCVGGKHCHGESAYLWLGRLRKLRLVEARDDRFVAAFTARPERFFWWRYWRGDEEDAVENSPDYVVAYVVRAVTPGTYVLPAATAEDMYRPKIRARTAMGTVTVLARP